VKQINAVQDASAQKRQMQDDEATKKGPPQHMYGVGLRKSPPEVNVDNVITKSPTNSVAAAASTLIYQKNYVDGNSGGKGGRTELYDSEDSDENECNASGLKEDDSSFCLEENSARSARSSATTLRIAGRIQTIRRAMLMLEMVERVK
jgi:hypothetical protein